MAKWDGDFPGNPEGSPAESNPYTEQPVRVRFGRKPYQLVDQPVAEAILCQLSETMPALFGRLLAEALIGPEAVPAKRSRTPR